MFRTWAPEEICFLQQIQADGIYHRWSILVHVFSLVAAAAFGSAPEQDRGTSQKRCPGTAAAGKLENSPAEREKNGRRHWKVPPSDTLALAMRNCFVKYLTIRSAWLIAGSTEGWILHFFLTVVVVPLLGVAFFFFARHVDFWEGGLSRQSLQCVGAGLGHVDKFNFGRVFEMKRFIGWHNSTWSTEVRARRRS